MESIKQTFNIKRISLFTISAIGLISGLLTIYVFFFQEKKASLEFEILSNTNVLDINASISKLDITYDGESLKKKQENLRIFVVRIKNNGNDNILKEFYDDKDPLGLSVKNGEIIETPEVVNTTNSYLKKNLKAKLDTSGNLLFNNLIMEANQSYTIKLLVLHPSNTNPEIQAIGKIAGQNEIPIVNIQQPGKERSIWREAFASGIEAQFMRFIAYGVIFLFVFIGVIWSVVSFNEWSKKNKRVKLVERFKNIAGYTHAHINDLIFVRFIDGYANDLKRFNTLLKNESQLTQYVTSHQSKDKGIVKDLSAYISADPTSLWDEKAFNDMLDDGLIKIDNNAVVVNKVAKTVLSDFVKFFTKMKAK